VTPETREDVVEVLLCAADLAAQGRGAVLTACNLLDLDHNCEVALFAATAWDAVAIPRIDSGSWESDEWCLLEAARLVEEGRLP